MNASHVTDDDFAAVLAVAADAGVLPLPRLVAEVDAELAARPDAPMWLINTSLALSLADAVRKRRTLAGDLGRRGAGWPASYGSDEW